jgi:hypothetical protein
MIEITDEMMNAYEEAAERSAGHPIQAFGAGLAAVIAVVERDYDVAPKRCSHVFTDGEQCERALGHADNHFVKIWPPRVSTS